MKKLHLILVLSLITFLVGCEEDEAVNGDLPGKCLTPQYPGLPKDSITGGITSMCFNDPNLVFTIDDTQTYEFLNWAYNKDANEIICYKNVVTTKDTLINQIIKLEPSSYYGTAFPLYYIDFIPDTLVMVKDTIMFKDTISFDPITVVDTFRIDTLFIRQKLSLEFKGHFLKTDFN